MNILWAQLRYLSFCAQVKLLKCLVEDMVIDISFETMGGILAASFLATLDQLISERCKGHGMLFTRSVILVSPDLLSEPYLDQNSAPLAAYMQR